MEQILLRNNLNIYMTISFFSSSEYKRQKAGLIETHFFDQLFRNTSCQHLTFFRIAMNSYTNKFHDLISITCHVCLLTIFLVLDKFYFFSLRIQRVSNGFIFFKFMCRLASSYGNWKNTLTFFSSLLSSLSSVSLRFSLEHTLLLPTGVTATSISKPCNKIERKIL